MISNSIQINNDKRVDGFLLKCLVKRKCSNFTGMISSVAPGTDFRDRAAASKQVCFVASLLDISLREKCNQTIIKRTINTFKDDSLFFDLVQVYEKFYNQDFFDDDKDTSPAQN